MNTSPQKPSLWASFWAAMQFLTIFPPFIRRSFIPAEMGASLAFYPLVGLLIGFLLLLFQKLTLLIFPLQVASALTLALWIILSGGLHLDGFLDACDGLLGGWTPEKRLEIMRDEHHGAFALAGGVLLLLLKFTALSTGGLDPLALLFAPMLGRWGMVLAVVLFPYQRVEGVGRTIKDFASRKHLLVAALWVFITAALASSVVGWVAIVVVVVVVLGGAQVTLRLIPGLTGDIYGALNELAELAVLLTVVAWKQF